MTELPTDIELIPCPGCGVAFQPNDGIGGHACSQCCDNQALYQRVDPRPVLRGVFFKCHSCGKPACVFPEGLPPKVWPGTVGHSLPQCKAFRYLSCDRYVRANASSERIDPPSKFDWFGGALLEGVTVERTK